MSGPRGQGTVEFAMIAVVLFGLLLAVIDLGRAGFMQHALDGAADDLARSLAAISGVNASGSPATYQPTPLDPANAATAALIDRAVARAAQLANGAFSATAALTTTGAMTLTNGEVTVVGTPDLTAPTEITVTVTAPFTPVVGAYLSHSILHLSASAAAITPAGQ